MAQPGHDLHEGGTLYLNESVAFSLVFATGSALLWIKSFLCLPMKLTGAFDSRSANGCI